MFYGWHQYDLKQSMACVTMTMSDCWRKPGRGNSAICIKKGEILQELYSCSAIAVAQLVIPVWCFGKIVETNVQTTVNIPPRCYSVLFEVT